MVVQDPCFENWTGEGLYQYISRSQRRALWAMHKGQQSGNLKTLSQAMAIQLLELKLIERSGNGKANNPYITSRSGNRLVDYMRTRTEPPVHYKIAT